MSTPVSHQPGPGNPTQGSGSGDKSQGNPLLRLGTFLRRGENHSGDHELHLEGGREADAFYRNRWSFDKVVRSTHGVNCTGSCSWKVYVKDGVITWESQQTDYPTTGPNMPDYEPRGCPRGAAFSWYTYSPTRIRYPYVRGVLVDMFREAKKRLGDPVLAWRDIVTDPVKAKAYKSARGKGGIIRISYEEAIEIAAAHVYTVREFGPDRIAGFTVIPAMSMISYGSGSRFLQLIGGVNLSFYDWYADLPPASPHVFGDQTDVPESGDWFNSSYLMMWGSNLPVTRTPDAHFMVEARYHGQKVVAVSPDFADNTKFADEWLRVNPGTDGALAMAMGHVILKEFHVDRQTPYFREYMRKYTDAPFLITLDRRDDGAFTPGKFLTASDLESEAGYQDLAGAPNATHRLLTMEADGRVVDPGGTVADRWGEDGAGKWNLSQEGVEPVMSVAESGSTGGGSAEVLLPRFDLAATSSERGPVGAGVLRRGVPTRTVAGRTVTTVFDLMLANYGVNRPELNLPGEWPTGYEDASAVGTPAWQEELTGVPMAAAARIGREFARNAEESKGRSQIVMGAGINHFFHADQIYRAILALTSMCGTQGVNGGGWAHYVGQEKLRPQTGWAQYTFALDWNRPPRQMISTGFYYLNTDQWRYDAAKAGRFASPLAGADLTQGDATTADTLVEASKRGWMPSYPQFNRNTLLLAEEAQEQGVPPQEYIAGKLNSGELEFACEDPDAVENHPKILLNWRTNLMGSSAKGTEFFLRHLLGVDSDASAAELAAGNRPHSIRWRDQAPVGKLDLMMVSDFRSTSTTLVSDLIFPAATWYEKHDLSSTDMHPFLHSFNRAIDPPWEARTDFELFRDLAKAFSGNAERWLGTQTDVVAAPLGHDSPDELGTPHGQVPPLGEGGYVPGQTMAKLVPVEREYHKTFEKFVALGPLTEKLGMNTKGIAYDARPEVEELALLNGTMETSIGPRPALDTDMKACEMVLRLSATSNGRLATEGFRQLDQRTGTSKPTAELTAGEVDKRITWRDVSDHPVGVITSPEWSGSEHGGRRYTAFAINVEHDKPWHTLSGRMHYYLDHDWMQAYGESLPVFKPPVDLHHLYGESAPGTTGRAADGSAEVTVRYLTPHNKWAIHSQYFDNLHMLSLARGGQAVWISHRDAEKIGVRDNEWIEAYNRNGVVSARAVVSHRIPEGTVYMPHASERTIGVPKNEHTGRRGGSHNSLTRIMIKPTHLIGGYGQLSYAFNYIGPTGNNRDEVTKIRRRSQEVEY